MVTTSRKFELIIRSRCGVSLFDFRRKLNLLFERQKRDSPDLSQISVKSGIGFIHDQERIHWSESAAIAHLGDFFVPLSRRWLLPLSTYKRSDNRRLSILPKQLVGKIIFI